jgi:NAD+ synthase
MAEIMPEKIIDRLTINPESVLTLIREFILRKYEEHEVNGIVLGLSGGLDSAVVAFIAAKTIDPTKVHTLHLFDRDSQPRFLEYAKTLVESLNIQFEVRDITSLVDEMVGQIRSDSRIGTLLGRLGVRPLTRYLSRRIYFFTRRAYHLVLILKRFGIDFPSPIKRMYSTMVNPTTSGFGPKHIIRRHVLEEYAAENNLLLLGAANRSEALIGHFVEGGVDDLPIEPIMGLYKNQVYHLAHFLGIPSEIIDEPPSPDMMAGITDESMIGLPWEKIDRILFVLENGFDRTVALEDGISSAEFDKVRLRYLNAKNKQGEQHEYPIY